VVATIIIFSLAYGWLLYETRFLTIRLLVGPIRVRPVFELMHCVSKNHTAYPTYKLPARTIHFHGSTLKLNEGCNWCRAHLLKTMNRELNRKHSTHITTTALPGFIEQVRIGSRHVYSRWNHETNEMEYANRPKKGYYHQVVNDYTTKYHDCIPGKKWLKENADMKYIEPEIEIIIDGKPKAKFNGNYKRGMIKQAMKVK